MGVSDQVFLEQYITMGCATGSWTGICMAHLTGYLSYKSLCTANATQSSRDIHVGSGAVLYRCAQIVNVTESV